jgi:hypothetical protein
MTSVPIELFEARVQEHRLELAKREMQLVRYRQTLIEHGIEPPDADGEELLAMWQECRHVISTASQFVMRLGSGKEMLVDWGER